MRGVWLAEVQQGHWPRTQRSRPTSSELSSLRMGDASTNIGMTAIKPVGWDRSGCEAFKWAFFDCCIVKDLTLFRYFLYNPETGEILSRTPLSWAKIILFYCVYYTCLGLSNNLNNNCEGVCEVFNKIKAIWRRKNWISYFFSSMILDVFFLSSCILDRLPSHLLPHSAWGSPKVATITSNKSGKSSAWLEMELKIVHEL